MYAAVSYTLSKATNTTEPDGNGIGPNDSNIARLAKRNADRASSISAIARSSRSATTSRINITAGTVTQFASARPFNATTGIDNNGDGANNDRPVIDGKVIAKSAFRGTRHAGSRRYSSRGASSSGGHTLLLRLEGFNLFNHGNILGRAQTTYGDTGDGESDVRPGWWPSARPPTRSRALRTSIRRGCSSSRLGISSDAGELVNW